MNRTPHEIPDVDLPPLDGAPGPALPIEPALADRMVRTAVLAVRGAPPAGPRGGRLVLVALALLAGGALVATLASSTPAAPRLMNPPPDPLPLRGRGGVSAAHAPAGVTAAHAPEGVTAAHAPAGVSAAPAAAAIAAPASAVDLLRRANLLRGQRRWGEAARLYRQVVREHAGAPERYPAAVAAASIELEILDRPASALRLYRLALAAHADGPLSEEARRGVEACARALAAADQRGSDGQP